MLLVGAGDWSTLLALGFLPLKDFLVGGFFGLVRCKLLLKNLDIIPEGLGEQVETDVEASDVDCVDCSTSVPPSIGVGSGPVEESDA